MEDLTWLVYLVASIGLSLTPGSNGLLALTHGAVGFVAVMALSLFGIGALLQASIVWLTALKWIGGAYLVYLGITVWRSPPIELTASATHEPPSGWLLFQQGALSALTNPKGMLFFIAFLPQFIDPARSLIAQFLIMAGTFVVVEVTTEFLFANAASRLRPWLRRVGRRFNQACGGLFMVIGSVLPFRS